MKIAVCIKRVPDSETRVKIASDGKSLDEAGVKFILNPYDEFAVEEGLRLKEKAETGEVVVVALGPPAAQRSEEHTSELQSQSNLVCRLLLEKKKNPSATENQPSAMRTRCT